MTACLFAFAGNLWAASDVPHPEMVWVPAGTFLMGSEQGATFEKPVHRVEITRFAIGRRPVSNREFRAFRPNHHSPADDADDAPVTGVSWHDAEEYCSWLSAQTGRQFRLPTEAEWERAARGGLEQKKYPWGDDPPVPEAKLAEKGYQPQPRPNPYGVEAGISTLWEWTADYYGEFYYRESPPKDPPGPSRGTHRVLRGGGYVGDPNSAWCHSRGSARPSTRSDRATFRVASGGGPEPMISELGASEAERTPAAEAVSRPAPTPASRREPAPPPAPTPAAPPATASPKTEGPEGLIELRAIDVTASDEQVSVTLTISGKPRYETMLLDGPPRLVVDLKNTVVTITQPYGSLDIAHLGVRRVRWAPFQPRPPVARVVVDLEQHQQHTIEASDSGLTIRVRPAR